MPTRQGQACAVATRLSVENLGASNVRSLLADGGTNQLPAAGLAPGGVVTITLPSCLGVYAVSATFADGRVVVYPGLDAQTIRQISVR